MHCRRPVYKRLLSTEEPKDQKYSGNISANSAFVLQGQGPYAAPPGSKWIRGRSQDSSYEPCCRRALYKRSCRSVNLTIWRSMHWNAVQEHMCRLWCPMDWKVCWIAESAVWSICMILRSRSSYVCCFLVSCGSNDQTAAPAGKIPF